MSIKLYTKRGKKSYKETRLIEELQPIIDKKLQENPELVSEFVPANDFEELKKLHQKYAAQEVQFEEINKNDDMAKKQVAEELEEDVNINDDALLEDDNSSFIDPFNREQPTTYDYTLEGGFSKDEFDGNKEIRSDFAEPISFNDAFELPDESSDDEPVDNGPSKTQKERTTRQPKERPEPINPSFDDMSSSDQRKQTKKFTKYIVVAICALAEKGLVWYANKDINENKLAEYEISGEIDTSILLTLDSGQEVTVKQFFAQQCLEAEKLAKFDDEEIKDIADALAAVFMEKGIAPTKMQELLIVIAGVGIKKVAGFAGLISQTKSLVVQLKSMAKPSSEYQEPTYQEPAYQEPIPQQPTYQAPIQEELIADEEMLEIDQVIETKE
jgi:hypothetical protein